MSATGTTYRWNTSEAAEAFDRAAEFIHPLYLRVQELVIGALGIETEESALVVDLGAGSGRLVERVLKKYPNARAVLVDQSEPFLAIAERRLEPFANRVSFVERRLQENWEAELPEAPRAIVSMSAIHHLDPAEKQVLYRRCCDALAPGSVFINGDEYRPANDADYLAALEWWTAQKEAAEARGQIPASFRPMFEAWYDRNVRRFGEPRKSGDDCHETIDVQTGYLKQAGFESVTTTWNEQLWGVIVARKAVSTA